MQKDPLENCQEFKKPWSFCCYFLCYFYFLKFHTAFFKLYKPLTSLSYLIPSSVASLIAFSLWPELEKVQSHPSAGASRRKTIIWKLLLSNTRGLLLTQAPGGDTPTDPNGSREAILVIPLPSSCLQTFLVHSCLSQLGYSLWAKALSFVAFPQVTLAALTPFVEGNKSHAEISGVLLFPFAFSFPPCCLYQHELRTWRDVLQLWISYVTSFSVVNRE